MRIDVSLLRFTPITLARSQVGDVQLGLLSYLLEVVEKNFVMPKIKKALEPGIPLVGAMGLTLTDLWLDVNDFLMARASIDWDLRRTLIEVFGSSEAFVDIVLKQMESTLLQRRIAGSSRRQRAPSPSGGPPRKRRAMP